MRTEAAGVQPCRVRELLKPALRIVPEENVLRARPDAGPRLRAVRILLVSREASVRRPAQVPHRDHVFSALILQRNSRHEPRVHDDRVMKRQADGVRKCADIGNVVLGQLVRPSVEGFGRRIELPRGSAPQRGELVVPNAARTQRCVRERGGRDARLRPGDSHGEAAELSRQAERLGRLRTLIDHVADEDHDVVGTAVHGHQRAKLVGAALK